MADLVVGRIEFGERSLGVLPVEKGAFAPVIPSQPKTYNDVATETFGPLDKYTPANDNEPQTVDFSVPPWHERNRGIPHAEARGQYIGLDRRHGDFMQVYSGRKFWPMDPRPEEVFIEDIAHSLALQTRYAGHCRRFYSVAEHSVLMARWLLPTHGPEIALWGLLHDASEAYLVDVPRPVKPSLVGYKEAEAKVMAAVCERFGLAADMPAVVHDADNRIIGDELVNLLPMAWHERYNEPLGVSLKCWYPEQAEDEFLATFEALTGRGE